MDTERKKNTVDDIIKNGTIKQKINLYMEDIAMRNISQDYENPFLTLTQIKLLSESINTPTEVRYYNQLARYSKGYLLYKPYLSLYKATIKELSQNIEQLLTKNNLNAEFIAFYDEIMDSNTIESNNKKKQSLKDKIEQKKNTISEDNKKIEDEIDAINNITQTTKLFFAEINTFLKKHLPIKSYVKFTKQEETEINNILKEISKKTCQLPITQIIPYDSIFVLVNKQGIDKIIKASK